MATGNSAAERAAARRAETIRFLAEEAGEAATELAKALAAMRDAADDEDSPAAAEALVALDVLAAKAKQLRTTVDRRIAAGLRAEQTALNALLAEPEFAGATVSYPELEQGFSPDMALAKDGVVTYVEFKRGRELQRAADNLADYVARHDPAARALLVVVGKPANAALPHIADRVRVRVLKAA